MVLGNVLGGQEYGALKVYIHVCVAHGFGFLANTYQGGNSSKSGASLDWFIDIIKQLPYGFFLKKRKRLWFNLKKL